MKNIIFLGAALALVGACGNSQQKAINEVQFGLTTASAVGRTAALAMDAMKGMPVACATVKTACSTFPCTTGEVTIALGPGCPLPLGGAATGTVAVTGSWSSVDQATLSQTFTNAQVTAQSNKALAVASVTQVSASRSSNTLTISYTGANAVAGASGSALAVGASNSWTVSVDGKGTADPADDLVTVGATSASAGGFSGVRVSSIKSAVLDPTCASNPTSGSAQITEVSGGLVPIPTIIEIKFHSACDGSVEVNGSTQPLQLLP